MKPFLQTGYLGRAPQVGRGARIRRRRFVRACEQLERREVLDASLQVIHNSPYAAAALVDVYVNDALLLDDFAFRDATPFVPVPAGVPLKIDVTGADAASNASPVFSTTATLADGTTYVAIAEGDPLLPSGVGKFNLAVSDRGRESAAAPGSVDLLVFHGAPDAPAVDVVARGVGTLVNDLAFPNFIPDYLSAPAANFTLDVTLADGATRVRSFGADLTGAAGSAIVVAASGFVAPAAGQPRFGLLAVFADGTTALLPELQPSVIGTNKADAIHARLAGDNPGVFQVTLGGQTTRFLTLTNPLVTIEGGKGNDTLTVRYPHAPGAALPTLAFYGGAGNDSVGIYGSDRSDVIKLVQAVNLAKLDTGVIGLNGAESVQVWAGAGDDLVDATQLVTVTSTLNGDAGNDVLRGGKARDVFFGGSGDDELYGGDGNDVLFGGPGNDKLSGDAGIDLLFDILGRNRFEDLDTRLRRLAWFG